MKIVNRRYVLLCSLLAASLTGWPLAISANVVPAEALSLLERVRRDMLAGLGNEQVREDETKIRALVDRVLVPHVDFGIASRLVLARHWENATEAQREAFYSEFRRFIIRFYTAALAGYAKDHGAIPENFMEFSDDVEQRDGRSLVVRSVVHQPQGEPITVAYRLVKQADAWKVIDVAVSGVSMAKTYRGSFSSIVERDGLDALIAYLVEKNGEFE